MIPCCSKCSNTQFSWCLYTPVNIKYNIGVVSCTKCGSVVGITEAEAVGLHVRTVLSLLQRITNGRL